MARRRTVIERPQAQLDVIELAMHFMMDSLSTAQRFVDAVESAYRRLLQYPRAGRRYESSNPSTTGLRFWLVPGFPKVLIFYLECSDGIEIVRVLHGARDILAILSDEFLPGE